MYVMVGIVLRFKIYCLVICMQVLWEFMSVVQKRVVQSEYIGHFVIDRFLN